MMNFKQIATVVGFGAVVVGVGYFVKQAIDDIKSDKKAEMTLAEARELIKQRDEEKIIEENKIVEFEQETTEKEYDFYDGLSYTQPLRETMTEEDKTLRFDPNSTQALDQFIKMELADLIPRDKEYQIMKKLYGFHFDTQNNGDDILYSQLSDYRMEFFGEDSVWNDGVSMADVVCHYARVADYNLDGGVAKWITALLANVEWDELHPDSEFEAINNALNAHRYIKTGHDSYSLFGLNRIQMDRALDWAEGTVDRKVSYEIEFNVFISDKVEDL